MGAIASLFSSGGFFAKNAGSIASAAQAATQVTGGILARGQAARNAKLLRRKGAQAETLVRREAKKLAGAQRARFAKAGVAPGEGTALDVVLETEEQARLQARRIRMSTEFDIDAQRQAGTVAAIQGLFGAGSTLLGDVARRKAAKPPATLIPPSKAEPRKSENSFLTRGV